MRVRQYHTFDIIAPTTIEVTIFKDLLYFSICPTVPSSGRYEAKKQQPLFYKTIIYLSECTDKGGTASGGCAMGFGTCCLFTEETCGSTVSENQTYVRLVLNNSIQYEVLFMIPYPSKYLDI